MGALASEAGNLQQSVRTAGADARHRQPGARVAERRVPAHARVRARDPARGPRDAGDDRRVVPVDRPDAPARLAGRAAGPRARPAPGRGRSRGAHARLAGAAAADRPGVALRARHHPADRRRADHRRVRDRLAELQGVLLDARRTVRRDRRTSTATARWCASRRAAARRRCRSGRPARRPASCSAPNVGVPLGNRPAWPGKRPAVPAGRALHRQRAAEPQRARVGQVRPDAAAGGPGGGARAALEAGARRAGVRGLHAPEDDAMRMAIRKHLRDFIAVIVLFVIAIAVSAVILSHQRLTLPAWVPFIGKDFFVIKAELATAQARHPGAGPDGQRRRRRRSARSPRSSCSGGRALVTLRIEPKYKRMYRNATVLLRPKTGLKDMVAELEPGGTKAAPPLREGDTIPISQTLPDVNLDEILASLDGDTRQYLDAAGHRRRGGPARRGRATCRTCCAASSRRRATWPASTTRWPSGGRTSRRAVHNFSLVVDELGYKDDADRELRAELQRGVRGAGGGGLRACARRCRSCPRP